MPRRRVVAKREIIPDPKFRSELLAKFVNCVMQDGKKSVAEKVVYKALDRLDELASKGQINLKQAEQDESGEGGESSGGSGVSDKNLGLSIFVKALDNIKPTVEVRSRRVGGATYQIPIEVRPARSLALAMRWLIESSRQRSEKGMILRLAGELADAFDGKGSAVKKREDVHRMAKANQAFAHFRWN